MSTIEELAGKLAGRIADRTATVAVIGLGYVGLPLVELFAAAGFPILGLDIDKRKVEDLAAGKSYIGHIPSSRVEALLATGRFTPSTDYDLLEQADAILICVPTPLGAHREPDLGAVIGTGKAIAPRLKRGQLVVLESTTYPGTTRDALRPVLEASGLVAGRDFFLAYSPEREDPGNPTHSAGSIPKVVGGMEPHAAGLACDLYAAVVPRVVPVSSCEVAEACKILENTYRAVNIALVNELKVLFHAMGIDVWEVIDAAKTKPFGFQAFYPGPGLGGHCLDGGEEVRVRAGDGSMHTVMKIDRLFERSAAATPGVRLGDVEVVEPAGLEVLSLDPETGRAGWRRVSHLFRKAYVGDFVEVRLAGNCRLRVTDRHPMLVVDGGELVVREARDLKPGDRVPQFCGELGPDAGDRPGIGPGIAATGATATMTAPARIAAGAGDWRTLTIRAVIRSTGAGPVYSIEVPGTHTFAATGGVFVHNCIPIDPFYLTWVARSHGQATRFIELAGEINTGMPHYVIGRVVAALNDDSRAARGSRVLVLGAAYKKDVDDPRESPSFELMEELIKIGAEVSYNDPHIPVLPPMRKHDLTLKSVPLTAESLGAADCVLICTDHSAYDWEFVLAHAKLVVDTRGATRKVAAGKARVVDA